MKNTKKLPTKQLEKFSNIFTQLGLVLVLFIVYITLEHQTAQKTAIVFQPEDAKIYYIEPNTDVLFTKEPKVISKINIIKTAPFIIDKVVKGDNNSIESIIDDPTLDPILIDIDSFDEIKEEEEFKPEDAVTFLNIQNAPVFKGCENLSKQDNKTCFDKKMKQFVNRNFNAGLANELGLRSGKYRIQTEFVINKVGNIIDVRIRAPHKRLEKETQRIIKKLPKFKPGRQNSSTVKVKYLLPITVRVE
jgi:protein TonB